MRIKYLKGNIVSIKNPRKPNGDLGDLRCSWCGCQTGAYIAMDINNRICKECLEDMVKEINKTILPNP